MEITAVRHLAWDFLEWSGGLPPESEHTVTVYVDYACPPNVDRKIAWRILIGWLHRQGLSPVERAKYGLEQIGGNLDQH